MDFEQALYVFFDWITNLYSLVIILNILYNMHVKLFHFQQIALQPETKCRRIADCLVINNLSNNIYTLNLI